MSASTPTPTQISLNTPRRSIIDAQTVNDIGQAALASPVVDADIIRVFGGSAHTQIGSAIGAMLVWAISAGYLPPLPGPVMTIICGAGAAIGAFVANWARQAYKDWQAKRAAPAHPTVLT